jgi:tRNA dimethylallyltransferase
MTGQPEGLRTVPADKRPVIIAGPTASGKSALALEIAARDGGCVINADALQVYNCWRVLSARPSDADLARAPHRLYGHVGPETRYSVGQWLRDMAEVLDETTRRGWRPVIVGGTGLYLSALTEGLAEIPTISQEVRRRSEEMLRSDGIEEMRAELARADPETHARIDLANPMRVQRAWEVLIGTGRGLAEWHAAGARPLLPGADAIRIVLLPETSILNSNIERRFRVMLEEGALDEVRAAMAAGWHPQRPSSRALGASELVAHLRGEMTLEAAVAAAVTATRRFAKRQRTWFRGRMADWTRIDPAGRTYTELARDVPDG